MDEFISEFQRISAEAKRTFRTLSAEQINWKPNEKTWSIGHCFEHLIITNSLNFTAIQKVIDGNHHNNFFSKIPFSTNLIATLMKNSLKPEQPRKMKTFKIFEPAMSNISSTIFEDFAENNRKLIEMFDSCKDLQIHKI
jgi:hypothetical protein